MKKYLFVLAAVTVATPALAQDDASTFTGPRAEIRAGFDSANVKVAASDGTDTLRANRSKDGVSYGGEIGYDYGLGSHLTVGAYAGIEGASTKYCAPIFGDTGCLKEGRTFTAGGRLGFKLENTPALFYVKGGYANTRLHADYAGAADIDLGHNFSGYQVGGGAEIAVTKHVYGKLEYTYSQYKKFDIDNGTDSLNVRLGRNQATAGVGYRF
jgi:outer membrane immunogenic protein